MTRRERAAHAGEWRKVARAIERRDAWCLCWGIQEVTGVYPHYFARLTRDERAIAQFIPRYGATLFWPLDAHGNNCRVVAAGLIAAMYETGEFDT